MRVTYSIGARFAGGGIGDTAYHAVRGLYRNQLLSRLLCGSYRSTEIPESCISQMGVLSRVIRRISLYDRKYRLEYAYRLLYDHWAARQLIPCHVVQGFSGYSLQTLRRAREMGSVVVLDREIGHPIYIHKLLQEEYNRWGLTYYWPRIADRVKREIALADYVLIPSDFVEHSFAEEGEPLDKLIQIPYGVDPARFFPAQEPRIDKPFRALFVGQVSIRKGVVDLLEAWQRLNWNDAELWLVGQDKLPTAVMNKYGQLPGTRFVGYVGDPVSMYQAADAFVFPSIAEGSALVNYEAMACALPVITTFNAGSIIRDGESGFIIPVRDPDAIAARLEQLRSDPEMRRQMGNAGRNQVSGYTWERYGDSLAHNLQMLSAGVWRRGER